MALVLNDRVRETTSVVGTGAVTLLGAVTGFQSFSTIGNANTTYYCISDQEGVNWEVGIGTYTASGTTLARTTVLSSSNAGALVVFPAGTKDVGLTYPAETSVSGGGGGTYPTIQPSLNLDFANTKLLDPRITFVRNSTAAYYDGQTTAMAEQNLLLYSQDFSQNIWLLYQYSSKGVGTFTAPDMTTSANSIISGTTFGRQEIYRNTAQVSGLTYTFSAYIKPNGRSWVYLGTNASQGVFFNISTGVIGAATSGFVGSIISAGSGWYRCAVTYTFGTGATALQALIGIASADNTYNDTGDGTSGVFLWGAQLEQRSSATAYTPTTTAAITNYIPVLMTAPAGVARFDCDPITGKSLGLLIEESRTNLLTYSGAIGGTNWSISNATVTPNTIIAPDGTLTGSTVVATATIDVLTYKTSATALTAGSNYTATRYAKAGSKNFCTLGLFGHADAFFDLVNLTYSFSGTGAVSASIVDVGNGWRRISATWLKNSSATYNVYLAMASSLSSAAGLTIGDYQYTWGAQLEAGSFATSYIPTVASTVTRAADNASITGTNFSSWYNQAESTIYAECIAPYLAPGVGPVVTNFTNSASQGAVYMAPVLNQATISSRGNGGSVGIATDGLPLSTGVSNKLVGTFKAVGGSTLAASICSNGRAVGTNAILSGNVLTGIDRLYFGFQTYSGTGSQTLWIKKIAYYPVALSSNNLVALTS